MKRLLPFFDRKKVPVSVGRFDENWVDAFFYLEASGRQLTLQTAPVRCHGVLFAPPCRLCDEQSNSSRRSPVQHAEALDLLLSLLTDKKRSVSEITAKTLFTMEQSGQWQPRDLKERVRFLVASAYAGCQGQADKLTALGESAIEPLSELVRQLADQYTGQNQKDESLSYAESAMKHLAKIHSPRNVETLIGFLPHSSGAVRHFAVEGLGAINDPRAIPYLAPLTKDFTYDHFHGARKSIADTARQVLVSMGAPARETIKALTNDPHSGVREWAQSALAKM